MAASAPSYGRLKSAILASFLQHHRSYRGSSSFIKSSTQFRGSGQATCSLKLGFPAPSFELPEPLTGKIWRLEDFKDAPCLWVMFLCNRSQSVGYLKPHLAKLAKLYISKGVGVVAISPSSMKVDPQDGPNQMAAEAERFNYPFPYLYDEDEAKLFKLAYHGQIDDSRVTNSTPITCRDMKECLEALLVGKPVGAFQNQSSGCPVKWHPTK